jgi:arylsulfatase A-like enzyme
MRIRSSRFGLVRPVRSTSYSSIVAFMLTAALACVGCTEPAPVPEAGDEAAPLAGDAPTLEDASAERMAGDAAASDGDLAESARPNILFIMSDDHGAQAIGAYGSVLNETPNIDRIASEGVRFTNCFVTNAICGPSRACILTGKYSHENGFYRNGNRFDGSQVTVPKLLREVGYETAMIGKWHLGTDPTGFDHWDILRGQGPYYNPRMRRNGEAVDRVGYTTDLITDLAIEWMARERDSEKPFFLMLHHKAPHRNWQPGPDHLGDFDGVTLPEPPTLFDTWEGRGSASSLQEMTIAEHLSDFDLKLTPPGNLTEEQLATWNAAYDAKNAAFREDDPQGRDRVRWMYQRYVKDYLRCVASVDDGVGRVLDWLDESGLSENTVVLYTSDQGWFLGEHGWYDKRWMYEESLRTPLLVRWPGTIEPGRADEAIVSNVDFAPTFLEIAGASRRLPAERLPDDLHGRSLVSVFRGERPEDWRTSFYYHYYEHPAVHAVHKHYGVRTDRYKLIHFYRLGEWELYDLREDPDEMRNVADDPAFAEIRRSLEGELRRLQRELGETDPEAAVPGDPEPESAPR